MYGYHSSAGYHFSAGQITNAFMHVVHHAYTCVCVGIHTLQRIPVTGNHTGSND